MTIADSRALLTGQAGPSAAAAAQSPLRFALMMLALMSGAVISLVTLGDVVAYLFMIPFTVLICYFAFTNTYYALMTYVSYTAIEGMYRYMSHFSQIIYVVSIVFMFIIVIGFVKQGGFAYLQKNKLPFSFVFVSIIVIGFMQIFNVNGSGIVDGVSTYVFWYLTPMMAFPLMYCLKKNRNDFMVFCYVFLFAGLLVSSVALIQYLMGKDWTYSHFSGIETAGRFNVSFVDSRGAAQISFRPVSTTTIGGGGGFWARAAFLPTIALMMTHRRSGFVIGLCLVALVINLIGLFIAGTRLYLMLTIIDVCVFIFLSVQSVKDVARAVGIAVLFMVTFRVVFFVSDNTTRGFVGERFESVLSNPLGTYQKARGYNLDEFFTLAAAYPFGIGYSRGTEGAGREVNTDVKSRDRRFTNRETQFAAATADLGLPGMILLLIICIGVILTGIRRCRRLRDPYIKLFGTMFCSMLISYLFGWFVSPVLQYSTQYWIYNGFVVSILQYPLLMRGR